MAQILRISRSGDRYEVLLEDGTVLTTHTGKATALGAAITYLHAGLGGEVLVLDEAGTPSSRTPVSGSQAVTTQAPAEIAPITVQHPEPQATEAPPAPEPRQRVRRSASPSTRPVAKSEPIVAASSRDQALDALADAAEATAEVVDRSLGLEDGDPVLPKGVSDTTIKSILPENVAKNATVVLLNTHVSVAAAWIAFVGLIFGTGTVSAVFQATKRAASGGTTVGDYASTAVVFFTASALCLSVAAAVWAVCAGKMKSYGAVVVWVIGTAIVSGLLSGVGLAAPSTEAITAAVDNGGATPYGWVASVLGVFLAYYGAVTYLSGLGVGAVAGHLAHRIQQAETVGVDTT